MSIIEIVVKKFCNESFGRDFFEILKVTQLTLASMLNGLFDLQPFGFFLATPSIVPSLITNVCDELWYTNGFEIYVQCIESHEFVVNFQYE